MTLAEQISAARDMGSKTRHLLSAVAVEMYEPKGETSQTFQATVSATSERGESSEGGFMMDHDSEARWRKDLGITPVLAHLFKISAGGRVMRIDEIIDHHGSHEWKVGLGKVSD